MFSLTTRGLIKDPAVVQEFERLFGKLRGYFGQLLDADGGLIIADPNLAINPVGAIVPCGGSTAPSGYLLCNGDQVSRSKYADLFNVVGTSFGPGDGSTTFNLPNLQGQFLVGKFGNNIGDQGGAETHTHTITSGGSHSHTVASHSHSIAGHTHTFSGTTGASSDTTVQNGPDASEAIPNPSHTHSFSGTTDSGGSGNTGNASPSTDSAGSHDHGGATASGSNLPPHTVINYLVYTGVSA